MSQTTTIRLLAGAAVSVGAAATASATTTTDEVRAVVAEMLADAETRSSLQAGGMSGFDDGFFLADPSGNYRLNVGGLVQFRYLANIRDDGGDVPDDEFENGFENSRTKLSFDGHIINPDLFYYVRGDFGTGGDFELDEAYAGYRFDNGWHLRFGQFRTAFLREESVLAEYQLVADRSITNEFFNQGYSEGIEFGYAQEDFRVAFAYTDGFNSANTPFDVSNIDSITANAGALGELSSFNVATGGGESDYAFTIRGEVLLNGTWDQFRDFTSMPGDEFGAMVGGAFHIQGINDEGTTGLLDDGLGGTTTFTSDIDGTYYSWTVDVSLEGDGWNVYAAGIGGHSDFDGTVTDNTAATTETVAFEPDDFGFVAQGGIFLPETDWEVFARYDAIFLDDDEREIDEDTFQTITFGTNWYWAGHAAKFTFDVQWFLDEANGLVTGRNLGYLGDDDENEVTLRAQFQLLF